MGNPLRLRYFAYETGRTVSVLAGPDAQVRSLTVLPPDYHAALSRGEVRRAEALARKSPDAPALLQRLTIARGLAMPPEADGYRKAHILFRDERSLRWHFEAVVDLSNDKVLNLQPVQ